MASLYKWLCMALVWTGIETQADFRFDKPAEFSFPPREAVDHSFFIETDSIMDSVMFSWQGIPREITVLTLSRCLPCQSRRWQVVLVGPPVFPADSQFDAWIWAANQRLEKDSLHLVFNNRNYDD